MGVTQKILIIGTVWPEPNSSAAGSRMLQLIQAFKNKGYEIHFCSSATDSEFMADLSALEVHKHPIRLNCSSFNEFIKLINPDIVLFDRFMTEEQFGWRVTESCPDAVKVLDTEDLHCLRYARQKAFKQQRIFQTDDLFKEEIAKREIASIYRCDLSLMISKFEVDILTKQFKIDPAYLYYLPFTLEPLKEEQILSYPSFQEREHFISIGNFLHEPNWNAVLYLKEDIWPRIRKKLPQAEIHIYGAYPSQKVWELHKPQDGFLVKGRAEEVASVMKQTRVCLAPLRFGAGLKGKLIDSMLYGTPNVTTAIGAEGMQENGLWNGAIANDAEEFANQAVALYNNNALWSDAVRKGVQIINNQFNTGFIKGFFKRLDNISISLDQHRQYNFVGQMLQHHQMASTKFMSRWIEEKNKDKI